MEERTEPGSGVKSNVPSERAGAKIWAVGGGKGGVGKSLMAVNMAILLTKIGRKVLLVDADFGTANLHTLVKTEKAKLSLSGFLIFGGRGGLRDVISRTAVSGLEMICGDRDSLDVAEFNDERMGRLWEALRNVEHDHVILDVGPGTSSRNLDIFLMAEEGVLVTTPDPTSIENMYRFLKCLYARRIRKIIGSSGDEGIRDVIVKAARSSGKDGMVSLMEIASKIRLEDKGKNGTPGAFLGSGRLSVVVNQVRRQEEGTLGPAIEKACADYFGLCVNYLGGVDHDEDVVDSVRARKPLSVHYVKSKAVRDISVCLARLLRSERARLR